MEKLKSENTLAMMLAAADEQRSPKSKAKSKAKTSAGAKAVVAAAVSAAMAQDAASSSSEDEDYADEEDNVSEFDDSEAEASSSDSDSESDGDFVPRATRHSRRARCSDFASGSSTAHSGAPIAAMASRASRKRNAKKQPKVQESAGVFYQTRSKTSHRKPGPSSR